MAVTAVALRGKLGQVTLWRQIQYSTWGRHRLFCCGGSDTQVLIAYKMSLDLRFRNLYSLGGRCGDLWIISARCFGWLASWQGLSDHVTKCPCHPYFG
jgi:hypothetical protein